MDIKEGFIRNKNIIFLVGPTAVGKTKISIQLAKIINGEIISCDSMQVYKDVDIISQKPTTSQLKQAPHHLISIIPCTKNFSVADFRKLAIININSIHKRKKVPIFVGGTALYMKALIDGLFPSPKPDLPLRKDLEKQGKNTDLYARLKSVDAKTAAILHPNDKRRIIRALEVYEKTGISMSELKKKTKGLSSVYNIKIFCLNRLRERLYERINKRVETMFNNGAMAECKKLMKKKMSLTASKILGYKEISNYINKNYTKKEAQELLKRNTRRFAKRQLSWFRNDPRIQWINIDDETPKSVARKIIRHCEEAVGRRSNLEIASLTSFASNDDWYKK